MKRLDGFILKPWRKFTIDPSHLEEPFSVEHRSESISGKNSSSALSFDFYDDSGKVFSKLTYVINGTRSPFGIHNKKYSGVIYLTFFLNADVGKWITMGSHSLLADYNHLASKFEFPLLEAKNVSKVVCGVFWAGPVKGEYRNLPKNFIPLGNDRVNAEIVSFSDLKKVEPSAIKAFWNIPSHGDRFARVWSLKNQYVYQKVEGLSSSKHYLLAFEAKNEFGFILPQVNVTSCENEFIASKAVTMQLAQTGWVRSGILFRPNQSCVMIKMGIYTGSRDDLYSDAFALKAAFSNNFDHVQLLEVPREYEKNPGDFVKSFGLPFVDEKVGEKSLDYISLVPNQMKRELEKEYESLGVPIYDLYFDEDKMWPTVHKQIPVRLRKPPELYYQEKMAKGYRNMFPATLLRDGLESKVRIKTRGVVSQHFQTRDRSLKISFKKNKSTYLLRPWTRALLGEASSTFVAKQLGLIGLENDFVFLRINDKPIGLYWHFNRNSKDIEANGQPDGFLAGDSGYGYHLDRMNWANQAGGQKDWSIFGRPANKLYREKYDFRSIMNYFLTLLKNNKVDLAENLTDVDSWIAWNVHSIIMGSGHQNERHNLMIYLNSVDGKLYPVPWDVGIHPAATPSQRTPPYGHYNPILDPFLRSFENFRKRNHLLWSYINSSKPDEMVAYHMQLWEKTKKAFEVGARDLGDEIYSNVAVRDHTYSYIKKEVGKQRVWVSTRLKWLKGVLSENRVIVPFYRVKGKVRFNNRDYSVLKVIVKPHTSMFSSIRVKEISVPLNDHSDSLYLINGATHEIKKGIYKDDRVVFDLEETLAGGEFIRWSTVHLWRDKYDQLLKSVEGSAADTQLLEQCYQPFSDREQYALKGNCLNDQKLFSRVVSVLQKTGVVKEDWMRTYYILHNKEDYIHHGDELLFFEEDPMDLSVVLENETTGDVFEADNRPSFIKTNGVAKLQKILDKTGPAVVKNPEEGGGFQGSSFGYKYFYDISMSLSSFVKKHPIFETIPGKPGLVKLKKGIYEIRENIIVPKKVQLTIEPGTVLRFDKGISLVSYGGVRAVGTRDEPILFQALDQAAPWGVVGLLRKDARGEFDYCLFENGSDAYINGAYMSGMLSAYYADASVKNSIFMNAGRSSGDDALNFKYGIATVTHSFFYRNHHDAIDFDFVKAGSKIEGNYFLKNGDDGVDVSGSQISIVKNVFDGSRDKGISVGENSNVNISDNFIKGTNMGIAVKDSSHAHIVNNHIVENRIGVAVYNKKQIFGGGHARVLSTLFENNDMDFGIERIDKNDRVKSGKDVFKSSVVVSNSKYRLTRDVVIEILAEPKKKKRSKKALLKSHLLGEDLSDYGYKYVALVDNISSSQKRSDFDPSQPIGIQDTPSPAKNLIPFQLDDIRIPNQLN